jgi:RNA polymerase sigma-70 factor (ECF subfamily)
MTNVDADRPDLSGRAGGAVLTKLYDSYARDLHRYLARRLDPVAADDLVAQTFLVAWEQRARYDPDRGTARTEASTSRGLPCGRWRSSADG